ncbi:hypothetical protein ACEYW6_30920 [Nostoc sp. UIC 10607]|uniref:hypothetical protein n=1 Tax=Nostoc sp. UIC 10607 TaxID=3045935 RepID=UPI0039A2529B
MITLNEVLKSLPPPKSSVIALPIAHLTSARSFNEIIRDVAFNPTHCVVFEERLLYFSYGGVFHRYGHQPTSEPTNLPVAFVFKPTLLRKIDYLFPYDTGAANKGLYNNQELCKFDNYRIHNDGANSAPKLVYYLYGSSKNYLLGEVVRQSASQIELIGNLLDFLQTDLCESGVDHRQRMIECQSTQQLSLVNVLEDIIWVGFPKPQMENFFKLIEIRQGQEPHIVPHILTSPYEYNKARRPSEIASVLEDEAYKKTIEYYIRCEEESNRRTA